MYNRLIFLVVFIAYGVNSKPQEKKGLSRAEVEDMLDRFILDCAAKEGATPEEIDIIRKYNPPTNKPQKCSIACVGESFGFMKNGNVLLDNVMNLATRILSAQPEKLEIVRKISETCSDGNDSDRCEASANVYMCAIGEAKNINFNLKDFI